MKQLYKYEANWYGEVIVGYTQACNENVAQLYSIVKIANIVQRTANSVRNHLLEGNRLTVKREHGRLKGAL